MFVRFVDGGSSNAIEAELASLTGPVYNLAGVGISIVAAPSHADLILLAGPLTRNMRAPLQAAFDVMPEPNAVVTTADWADTQTPLDSDDDSGRLELRTAFAESYAFVDLPLQIQDRVVAHVAGNPPTPRQLGQALVAVARGRARWRRRRAPGTTLA
jgi:Ni,Fe-hydrogenase III small subunit